MRRVVKIGGRAQADPGLAAAISAAASGGGALCVVHGGGDEVTAFQRRLGMEPKFVGGRRVTSTDDLEIVRMVLSGTTNKRLVSQLLSVGVRAVGVSGEDAGLLSARVTDPSMGRVGGHTEVHPELIELLMGGRFVPIISPLARDADDDAGAGLNVNGDDAAAAIAVALLADDLVLVADVPGVLDGGNLVPSLDLDTAAALVKRGVASGGMAAKLDAASWALRHGVRCVRIAAVSGIGDTSAGTRLLLSPSYAK